MELSKYAVGRVDSIFYIPDFITAAEQSFLLHQVNSAPSSKWKTLTNRRLQNWGGIVESNGLVPQPLPSWLTKITEKISSVTGLFPSPINHVLVNEYLPGQGIMLHQDGPSYFPVVAILSLGAPTLMRFKPHLRLIEATKDLEKAPENTSVALLPGSLLIFKDAAYQDYLHGIDESREHRLDDNVSNTHLLDPKTSILQQNEARVSLTCRFVPKLRRNFIKL
ncbi:alpha-ketoglutarate-dependent dioxygenase alkB homolog 6 [Selaginella moellendorffii]|uniref:alpha-ketoglutarate-dependent dioxygenase alkB homolog 6 n=1 Tax=Selaginella moellendorffii TaxID=88036 RepID=UPI000D1C753A|nr:alpha-ketoglutarate-dependent dioxygenase alkB homolog 6 [Selaginella moellendorffii]|eukprot:XP_024522833.1 alpha-ketoglutarate-dependent dioxygenase alkB homolog 6 [Selaginella moellendorffii]